jgi:hypothetical protein
MTRTGPANLRWFWALYAPGKPGTLRTDSRAATLDQAKAKFEASWRQWEGVGGDGRDRLTSLLTGHGPAD